MAADLKKSGKLRLYSAAWCWYCQRVIRKLDQLGLPYDVIEVPIPHSKRREVLELSGQTSVPVLVDGAKVIDDDDRIVPYLEETYGRGERSLP